MPTIKASEAQAGDVIVPTNGNMPVVVERVERERLNKVTLWFTSNEYATLSQDHTLTLAYRKGA